MSDFPRLDRRQALKCLSWAGAGIVWSLEAGIPVGRALGAELPAGGLHFVQISDTHIGFAKEANPDTAATTGEAVARIRAMATPPALILHTGDVSHLSKPAEFDLAHQLLSPLSAVEMHVVPGEHDVLDEQPGLLFRQRFPAPRLGDGWYSFDHQGVHFVALINVLDMAGGGGRLGAAQLAWLQADLAGLRDSTPIVVFAHIPLWSVYDPWGWTTSDAAPALAALRRFGSVTILNGHIHQVMQKVESTLSFRTAASLSYPQPKPGEGAGPGPLKVPADQLRGLLGLREVTVDHGPAGMVDHALSV